MALCVTRDDIQKVEEVLLQCRTKAEGSRRYGAPRYAPRAAIEVQYIKFIDPERVCSLLSHYSAASELRADIDIFEGSTAASDRRARVRRGCGGAILYGGAHLPSCLRYSTRQRPAQRKVGTLPTLFVLAPNTEVVGDSHRDNDESKCFNCGQPGHSVAECPEVRYSLRVA